MQVKCSQCEKFYKVNESAIGKKVKCKCGFSFVVPGKKPAEPNAAPDVPPLPTPATTTPNPPSPAPAPPTSSQPAVSDSQAAETAQAATSPFSVDTNSNQASQSGTPPTVQTNQSSVLQSRVMQSRKSSTPAWMIWGGMGVAVVTIIIVVIMMGQGNKNTSDQNKVANNKNKSNGQGNATKNETDKGAVKTGSGDKKTVTNDQSEPQTKTETTAKNSSNAKTEKTDADKPAVPVPAFTPDIATQIELSDWELPDTQSPSELLDSYAAASGKDKEEIEELLLRAGASAVPLLIEKVTESDGDRSSKFGIFGLCQLLSKIGRAALDPLINLAKDSSLRDETRSQVLRAIGDMGPLAESAIEEIAKIYDDAEKPSLRGLKISSTNALAKIGVMNDRVKNIFSEILINDGKKFGTNFLTVVLKGARDMGPAASPLVPEIRSYLLSGSYQAQEAAEALGAIGPEAGSAAEEFKQLIENEDKVVTFRKFHALRDIGAPAKAVVPALIEALKATTNSFERANIADSLGRMGISALDAVPTLNEYLQEAETTKFDQAQRVVFHLAIARIQGDQRAAIPYLRNALTDNKHNARAAAAEQIGTLGSDGRELVPDLVSIIQNVDSKQGVVRLAIQSLGNLRKDGTDGLGALIDFINRQHADPKGQKTFRLHAIDAIAKINSDERVLKGLTRIAHNDPDLNAREKATRLLQKLAAQ